MVDTEICRFWTVGNFSRLFFIILLMPIVYFSAFVPWFNETQKQTCSPQKCKWKVKDNLFLLTNPSLDHVAHNFRRFHEVTIASKDWLMHKHFIKKKLVIAISTSS